MKTYNTKELMELLGVSRTWINANLRHLGSEKPVRENAIKISVIYEEKDLIEWFNENATFTRQTILEDLNKYVALDVIENYEQEEKREYDRYRKEVKDLEYRDKRIKEIEYKEAKGKRYLYFLEKNLEPVIFWRYTTAVGNVRSRGNVPHININYQIKSLNELYTMNAIKEDKSEEMGYRDIYINSMIKAQINGRKWFIYEDINYEHQILLTAV